MLSVSLIQKVSLFQGYNWNTECLHGLGAICATVNGVTRCPSVFPAPPAMVRPPTTPAGSRTSLAIRDSRSVLGRQGATFNLSIAYELGKVISDEIRAYSNSNGHRDYQNRPVGVSAWGPNL